MTVSAIENDTGSPSRASYLYDPKVRSLTFQVVLALLIVYLFYSGISNAVHNLAKAGISSGFGFLEERAGFDIAQTVIPYTNASTYLRAFFVGLTNTLLIAVIGIFFATIIGFVVGIARLSRNFLVRLMAACYVELFRNIPLLLQLLFWYKAVLSVLPGPRQSYNFLDGSIFLSNRGLLVPRPIAEPGAGAVGIALLLGIVLAIGVSRWAYRRQMATGQPFPRIWTALGLIIGLPLVVFVVLGAPFTLEFGELKGFNFVGGQILKPEFMALLLGISLYTASFIAEIVRAGILAVSKGQTEAAYALGLRPNDTMRLVVVPQALRVIIPPLTSQYLNLTKNSSLAVAVGYPDLVAVFAGTVLNQTGQAVEVILITMLVYLVISLATSSLMNWFNARVALVER